MANGWLQEVPRLCLVVPPSKPSKPGEITYDVVGMLSIRSTFVGTAITNMVSLFREMRDHMFCGPFRPIRVSDRARLGDLRSIRLSVLSGLSVLERGAERDAVYSRSQ